MKPDNATILATIKAHATTKTYEEIAGLLGASHSCVAKAGRKAGFKKLYVSKELRVKQAHQRRVIVAHASTHSLAQIAPMLGVTKERVRQLCEKWRIKRRNFMYSPLRRMSRMTNAELRKLARQPDKSLCAIAREAGVCHHTLTDELRRRGMQLFTRREHNAMLLKRGLRLCRRCRRIKPLERFYRSDRRSVGYEYYCKECLSINMREWNLRRKARSNETAA